MFKSQRELLPNQDLRRMLQRHGLTQYNISEYLGIAPSTVSLRLRQTLTEAQKQEIRIAIYKAAHDLYDDDENEEIKFKIKEA